MEFVADRSFAYRFSRYELLPELQQLSCGNQTSKTNSVRQPFAAHID